jgi:hypothetical protein
MYYVAQVHQIDISIWHFLTKEKAKKFAEKRVKEWRKIFKNANDILEEDYEWRVENVIIKYGKVVT